MNCSDISSEEDAHHGARISPDLRLGRSCGSCEASWDPQSRSPTVDVPGSLVDGWSWFRVGNLVAISPRNGADGDVGGEKFGVVNVTDASLVLGGDFSPIRCPPAAAAPAPPVLLSSLLSPSR